VATFKTISSADIKSTRSYLNQLVDFVENDISGSSTRRKYKVFVTGGIGPGVTSSLFHTIYDQDYQLQTANALFDITVGLYSGSNSVTSTTIGQDSAGKLLFPSSSLMMREKVNIYRQFAQTLLGNADHAFVAPFQTGIDGSSFGTTTNAIGEALFLTHKRLFVRDGIKRETFAMRFFQSSSFGDMTSPAFTNNLSLNPPLHSASGSFIYTDVGSATSIERSPTGGDVGNIVDASDTSRTIGLMFYQEGVAILDMSKITSGSQLMRGDISAINTTGITPLSEKFIPGFITSASIDDILDHITETRFGSGSNTVMTYQNNTQINSTLVFCRATADEFNYSTNPTYTDENGRIIVIDETQQNIQKSFSFVSTVGLFDANDELLAVAKLSRPVEKNDEKDLTFRVRLDF
jgi:hypothetical protein